MLETILQQRYYITAVLLFSIGFVTQIGRAHV